MRDAQTKAQKDIERLNEELQRAEQGRTNTKAEALAGSVPSPSKSRTVLSYSKRVRRRRGALPGCSPSQAAGGCGGGGLGGASRVQAAILVREHPL